jgi:hypothetical protein
LQHNSFNESCNYQSALTASEVYTNQSKRNDQQDEQINKFTATSVLKFTLKGLNQNLQSVRSYKYSTKATSCGL